jgi:hypothetical protein
MSLLFLEFPAAALTTSFVILTLSPCRLRSSIITSLLFQEFPAAALITSLVILTLSPC